MAEGKCIKIIKSAPYLVVMTAGNTICCGHALRGRGSRNFSTYRFLPPSSVTPCEGVGVEICNMTCNTTSKKVTPCEGVGVEIYKTYGGTDTTVSRLARAWE